MNNYTSLDTTSVVTIATAWVTMTMMVTSMMMLMMMFLVLSGLRGWRVLDLHERS